MSSPLGRMLRRLSGTTEMPVADHCANCGERLMGRWCHACGQHSEDLHRSVRKVALEWVQGLVHFDARAKATLPDLALNPARLTSNYLAGRRAPQIPPLKMFLVVLVIVFFAESVAAMGGARRDERPFFLYVGQTSATGLGKPGVAFTGLSPAQKAELAQQIAGVRVGLGPYELPPATAWVQARMTKALADPVAYGKVLDKWARRLAFLLLPIGTALLSLLFVRRREVMVYDHLIFTTHSLSFQGLLLTAVELVNVAPGSPGDWLLLAGPAHLWAHLRGVYGTSRVGAAVRAGLLIAASLGAFVLLLVAALSAGLVEIGR
jgi:hypothetical protein